MPSSPMVDALRLLLGVAFLMIASYRDLRTRKVPNSVWYGLVIAALVVLVGDFLISESPQVLLLTPIPVAIFFFTILTEGDMFTDYVSGPLNISAVIGLNILAFGILWYQGESLAYSEDWYSVLVIPIMLGLFYIFYITRLLHGGADAKAFMGLSVLVPFYPVLDGFPLIEILDELTIIPFSIVILMNAAVVTLFVPLGYALFNLVRGDVDKRMFFGYKLKLREVKKKFVWLMERVEDGKVVTVLFPKRGREKLDKQLRALKKKGRKKVWVTPKIPFMVSITVGYILSFLLGNMIFGLVEWAIP